MLSKKSVACRTSAIIEFNGASFLNRTCAYGARLESILLADPLKIFFRQHRCWRNKWDSLLSGVTSIATLVVSPFRTSLGGAFLPPWLWVGTRLPQWRGTQGPSTPWLSFDRVDTRITSPRSSGTRGEDAGRFELPRCRFHAQAVATAQRADRRPRGIWDVMCGVNRPARAFWQSSNLWTNLASSFGFGLPASTAADVANTSRSAASQCWSAWPCMQPWAVQIS